MDFSMNIIKRYLGLLFVKLLTLSIGAGAIHAQSIGEENVNFSSNKLIDANQDATGVIKMRMDNMK